PAAGSVIPNAAGNTLVLTGVYSNSPLNFLTFGSLEFRRAMTGNSNVVMTGPGTLHLSDTNCPYAGNFAVRSGLTHATSAASLGLGFASQTTGISNGATLLLKTNGEFGQQLAVGGTLHVTTAGTQFDSDNAVTQTNATFLVDAGASLNLLGPVGGPGGLRKD